MGNVKKDVRGRTGPYDRLDAHDGSGSINVASEPRALSKTKENALDGKAQPSPAQPPKLKRERDEETPQQQAAKRAKTKRTNEPEEGTRRSSRLVALAKPPVGAVARRARTTRPKNAPTLAELWHKLPPELRSKIWGWYARLSKRPRLVFVQNYWSPAFVEDVATINLAPECLRICSEASQACLPHLRLMFARFPLQTQAAEAARDTLKAAWDAQKEEEAEKATAAQKSEQDKKEAEQGASSSSSSSPSSSSSDPPRRPKTLVPLSDKEASIAAPLSRYEAAFESVKDVLDLSERQLIDPETDIIFIPPCCIDCQYRFCPKQFLEQDRAVVKSVAVAFPGPQAHADNHKLIAETVASSFPALETLYLVLNHDIDEQPVFAARAMLRKPWSISFPVEQQRAVNRFRTWKRITERGAAHPLTKVVFTMIFPRVSLRLFPGLKPGQQYPGGHFMPSDVIAP